MPASVSHIGDGVYSERRPHRRVNTQLSNRFVAMRPLNSIKLAVRENASRISPVGSAVTAPTPDHGDPAGGGFADEVGPAFTLPSCPASAGCAPETATVSAGETLWAAGAADPRPSMARVASARSPVRASSIIPSNKPRIETPRRSASASTQARRSWSSRMPTTVDLEVAMTSLTVIRGVYSSGAERWQAGGGHPVRHRLRIGSGTHERRIEATPTSPEFRPLQTFNGGAHGRRAREPQLSKTAAANGSVMRHRGTLGTSSTSSRGDSRTPGTFTFNGIRSMTPWRPWVRSAPLGRPNIPVHGGVNTAEAGC